MLTDEVIDLLGSYYGKAIRDSVGTDYETMRKAVWATYFHLTSTDDAPTHHFCPRGTDSWCFFNRALAEGAAPVSHKMKSLYLARIPFEKLDLTRSVYRDLTAPDILRRCLKGATQNPNENLHSKIWIKCSKAKFSGRFRVLFVTRAIILDHNYRSKRNLLSHLLGVNNTILQALEEQDRETDRKGTSTKRRGKKKLVWSSDYQPGAF